MLQPISKNLLLSLVIGLARVTRASVVRSGSYFVMTILVLAAIFEMLFSKFRLFFHLSSSHPKFTKFNEASGISKMCTEKIKIS